MRTSNARQLAFGLALGVSTACGGEGSGPNVRQVECPEKITIAVGASVRLNTAQAECLQFAREAQSEFILSYADSFSIAAARDNPFLYAPRFDQTFDVWLGLDSTTVPALTGAAEADAAWLSRSWRSDARSDRVATTATQSRYAIGDTIRHQFVGGMPAELAEVVATYGDYFVVAVRRGEVGDFRAIEPKVAWAFERYLTEAEPFLARVFGGTRPVSNTGGQFLVFSELLQGTAGAAWPDRIQLAVGQSRYATSMDHYLVLAHEMAHVKQFQYTNGRGSGPPAVRTQWAVEGGAKLVEGELARRGVGVDLLANWDWTKLSSDPYVMAYQQLPVELSHGDIAIGYGPGAAMLRDLVQRLVVSGMTADEALSLVLQASLHGWFGCTSPTSCSDAGLAPRMALALGTPFDPTYALLRLAASQAADDLTANQEFQNPSFLRIGAMEPDASTPLMLPLLKSVNPSSAEARNRHMRGSVGGFRIRDGGAGTAYAASASVPLEWLVLRIR